MYCKKCGFKLESDSNFCEKCGTKVEKDTIEEIVNSYEEEVDNAVKDLTGLIQPILIVGIGLIIGFIVIALYLPLFDMGNIF